MRQWPLINQTFDFEYKTHKDFFFEAVWPPALLWMDGGDTKTTELQRLLEVFNLGFITEEEFKQRSREIGSFPQILCNPDSVDDYTALIQTEQSATETQEEELHRTIWYLCVFERKISLFYQ